MEIEIKQELALTEAQGALLDMHSFLNILNVWVGELQVIQLTTDDPHAMAGSLRTARQVQSLLESKEGHHQLGAALADGAISFQAELSAFLEQNPRWRDDAEVKESVANINSVLKVMSRRVAEYLERLVDPAAWHPVPVAQLVDNFRTFFAAVEKNSKGRYRIIFNIAGQEVSDYVVNLRVESVDGPMITMPLVLQDVFRDLIANARKYTPVGGVINAGLLDDGQALRLVVEDTGRGIPAEELPRVVEYGYRASNAADVRGMGGGFGLTKAYAVTRQHGGRMWIRSVVGVGTRVTIHLPRPHAVLKKPEQAIA